ncbi:MAG: hypothetical protein KA169_13270, partial [Burkholderiaceae bacterium]|nr:hypothetical protein [Burkholderiaceae bacterium]
MLQTSPPIRPFDLCLALAVQAIAVALWLALGRSWIVPGLACATLMGATVIRLRGPQALCPAGLMLLALVWGIGIALDLPADGQGRVALLAIGLGHAMVLAPGARRCRSAPAACGLKPCMSAHRFCLKSVSLGMTPCSVSTFCPARGPKAMRYVQAA